MKELRGLSLDQNKKFKFAIECGYLDDWETDPRKWKHTFVGAFLWKYPSRVKILNIIKDIIGNIPTWGDLNDETLRDLVDELIEQGLATSSIRTMCAELKVVLNENVKKVPCDSFQKILSVKGSATKPVYLTSSEMELLLAFKPRTETEHYVHRNFCVSMLTGARLVDTLKLTISNCDIETNMLSYIPTAESAVLSWTAGGEETQWQLDYNGTVVNGTTCERSLQIYQRTTGALIRTTRSYDASVSLLALTRYVMPSRQERT